jgi:hypothetical protein
MRIYNTEHRCEAIQRHVTYIQLYKLLETHTEQKEINNIIETVITGRDYEFVSLNITDDMEIINGVDPLENDFDLFFQRGLQREMEDITLKKIQKAREERWKLTDTKVFNNNVFSNLASERNANLLFMSIERYKKGKYVNWMNLNGDYVKIDDNNLPNLESLYSTISDFTQYTFDALDVVIKKIKNTSNTNELLNFNVAQEWNNAFTGLYTEE